MKLLGIPQSTSAGQNRKTYSTLLGNATAGDTVFAVTYEQGRVDVFLNGARLVPDQDFTRTANGLGTSVTLVSGISAGDYVDLVGHVGLASNAVSTDNFVVGTSSTGSGGAYAGSTTVFPVSSSSGDKVNFYLNGVLLDSTDYTIDSVNSTVTLAAAAATNDIVEVQVIGALVSTLNPSFSSIIVSNITSSSGAVVINEAGADVDFRVESDFLQNALFVEGSTGRVGIGTTSPPLAQLEVNGDARIHQITVGRGAGGSSQNTVLGNTALASNTTGSYNTAVGIGSLQLNTTGGSLTAIGSGALYANETGNYNTAIGRNSGFYITSGSKNTILGPYNGNQGSLDIRTSDNNIVLSDGDGNPRAHCDSSGNWDFNGNLIIPDGGTIGSASDTDAITIDSSGNITLSRDLVPNTPLSHRNLIINGAMQVAQRGTQATGITSTSYETCDRFKNAINALGTWTSEQSTDAPADFKYSWKLTCTTADSSPAVNDYLIIQQLIEGQNLAHLNYGSSDAKELTLSFWVKSNKTGTIGQEMQTSTSYERTVDVTINAANTWEYKTISIPANTLYSTAEDNSTGLAVSWWINAGSTYKGTPTSTWGTNNSGRGGTLTSNIGTAVNDYIAITGVQLELGSVATPFEHRSYGEELARCQRYYQEISNSSGSFAIPTGYIYYGGGSYYALYCQFLLPVEMRAAPSLTFSGTGSQVFSAYGTNTTAGATPWSGSPSVGPLSNGKNVYFYTLLSSNASGGGGTAVLISVKQGQSIKINAEL